MTRHVLNSAWNEHHGDVYDKNAFQVLNGTIHPTNPDDSVHVMIALASLNVLDHARTDFGTCGSYQEHAGSPCALPGRLDGSCP